MRPYNVTAYFCLTVYSGARYNNNTPTPGGYPL